MNHLPVYLTLRYALFALVLLFGFGMKHSYAQSAYLELPGEMGVHQLPKTAYVMVLSDFMGRSSGGVSLHSSSYEKESDGVFRETRWDTWNSKFCKKGSKLSIEGYSYDGKGQIIDIVLSKENECGMREITFPYKNRTVGMFNREYADLMKIVDGDLYRDFSDDVTIDLLMAKISTAIKSQNYAEALPSFVYLENRIENLPESFWYHYLETASNVNDKEKVRALGTKYIKDYGKKGKYYGKVITLMAR